MPTELEIAVVRKGLAQIDRAGLRRLVKHIDAGKPLLLSGKIESDDGEYG